MSCRWQSIHVQRWREVLGRRPLAWLAGIWDDSPTRSGGLRTSLGRHDNLQKSPFQKPPMIKGSFRHFFVQSSTLPGWFIAVWLRHLRCIGFSRKIKDPLRNRCRRGESGFAHYWLTCHSVINSIQIHSEKQGFVLLSNLSKFTPSMLQWHATLEIC